MKINQLKVGVILSYISMGASNIVSLIYTPIMLRLLGQSEYGLYSLVSSVVSYLGLFNFGFTGCYIRFYTRYKSVNDNKGVARLNGMFISIYLCLSLLVVLVGFVFAIKSNIILGTKLSLDELNTARVLIIIMVFNMAFSLPMTIFGAYINAHEQFVFQKILSLIRVLVNPLVILPVLFMGYGSIGLVAATTLVNVLVSIVNVVFCLKKLKMKFDFTSFDFALMLEMTFFSFYIFLNMILDQISWNVDKYILGRFRGTATVAVYSLAATLNQYYLAFSSSISSVFEPRVNKMAILSDNDNISKLFVKVGRIQFMVLALICSGFIFFGKSFISMWAGDNYETSYYIVLLLMIPITIPLIQNLGITIQRAKNMHKFRSIVLFVIAICNLGISIPLAKAYGGIGAAAGTAIALIIGPGFIMNWYYNSRLGLDIPSFWKEIISLTKALVIPLVLGTCFNIYGNLHNLVCFVLLGVLYCVIYCVSMWILGMNDYERNLMSVPIKKLYNKFKGL